MQAHLAPPTSTVLAYVQVSTTRCFRRIRRLGILSRGSVLPGIHSTAGRPPFAQGSDYLMSCPCRTCLRSILCKLPPTAPKLILVVVLEKRAPKDHIPRGLTRSLVAQRGLEIV